MATSVSASPQRRINWAWLGVLPFFIFPILFIFIPSASLFIDSFRNADRRLYTSSTLRALLSRPFPSPIG